MNVDDLLARPGLAADLPDGAIPLHAIILIEYAEPGSEDEPGAPRLTCASDDDLSVWNGMGMLKWAEAVQKEAMRQMLVGDDEEEDE